MKSLFALLGLVGLMVIAGCADPYADEVAEGPALPEDTGILGQTTDDIREFKPNAADQTVSDGKMKEPSALNPMGMLNAYGPAVQKLSKGQIKQAVNLFWAEKGRYPKTYEEFMEQVIKKNKIQLPMLPLNLQYQYDVANHELVVVEVPLPSEKKKSK